MSFYTVSVTLGEVLLANSINSSNGFSLQVTVRIFWSVNRSWSGHITASELRRSNFLEVLLISLVRYIKVFAYFHCYLHYEISF